MGTLLLLISMFGLLFTSMFNNKGSEHMMDHKVNNKIIIFFFILFSSIVIFIGINILRFYLGYSFIKILIN